MSFKYLIDEKIKRINNGLVIPIRIKLGRCINDVYLADSKGNILIKNISRQDLDYLERYSKKEAQE